MNGSTTMLPIIHKIVESYNALHNDVTVAVTGGGSGNGVKALIDGYADIAMSSRELQESEIKLAASKKVRIMSRPMTIDALCPIVNPANPVNGVSLEQLRDIFSGKITNWSEVGGENKAIAVFSRDTSSGTFESWRKLVMDGEKIFPGAALLASSGIMLQEVSHSRQAIGYEGFCYVTGAVKALRVEGVAVDLENVRSGRYKLARFFWLFAKEAPSPEVAKFLDYMLGPQGRAIVTSCGAVPVDNQ
ncbi:MAG: phosphate ABC transporter substrate-binding protein [Desulfovibrionaceae bacterium]|nr:phosphate ABC transporter substrate-binding protein [Desulfovibrionaceae bacterium]